MAKKINFFALFFILIFSLSISSAAEFDNFKSYNEELRVVTITNAYGLGDVIGQARLNTPLNVKVGAGYQKVAEFDIWAYQDYNDAIKQFSFTDMKNKEKINRDFDLKMLSYENITVDDYEIQNTGTYANGTIIYEKVLVGNHVEIREVWKKVTPADLKKSETLTIGIFTDVQVGDYVDWIPTIYGVKIDEWATWTADLNTDLVSYYKFDVPSGNLIDSLGTNNFTASGSLTYQQSGILNYSIKSDGGSGKFTTTDNNLISSDDTYTYNSWFKNNGDTQFAILGAQTGGTAGYTIDYNVNSGAGNLGCVMVGVVAATYAWTIDTDWHMVSCVGNSSGTYIYFDGSNVGFGVTGTPTGGVDTPTFFSRHVSGGYDGYFSGYITEFGFWNRTLTNAEISDLWNGGTGITYTNDFGGDNPPQVTLTSPANYTTATSPYQNFVATVTDDLFVQNVSLLVDGSIVSTNTSNFNGSYTFSYPLSIGEHNWSILAYDNSSQSNESETRIITYTGIKPSVELIYPDNYENLSSANINFEAIVTDDFEVENVTLYLDGVLNGTNTSSFNGTYIFPLIVSEGYHNWSILAFDNESLLNQSETRFFNYTQPPIYVNLNAPDDAVISNNSTITMNCTGYSPMGVTNLNLTIDGVLNETLTNSTSAENLTLVKDVTYSDGGHNWSCKTNNYMTSTSSATRTLTIDTIDPIVNIIYPLPIVYNETVTQINYSVTESDQDKCWYSIDGGTTNSTDVASGTNFTGLSSIEGVNNWTVYCNDTAGNEGSETVSFSFVIQPPTSGVWTDEYQIRITALGLTESDFTINGVTIYEDGENTWKLNATTGDYEIDRARIIKTLFYGSDGSDPRINRTTGLTSIQSLDNRDNGRRGIYAQIIKATSVSGTYDGTFLNTTNNQDVSSWSSIQLDNLGTITNASWNVGGTVLNSIDVGTSNEIGTDTSADQKNNPSTCSLNAGADNDGGWVDEAIILSVGGISWIDTGSLTSFYNIDFTINYSIPEISPVPNITLISPNNSETGIPGSAIVFNSTVTLNAGSLSYSRFYINDVLNETINITGTENTSTFNKTFSSFGTFTWKIESCDTLENCAVSDTRTFSLQTFDILNTTYDLQVTEGAENTITVNIDVPEESSLESAILSYNGTNYTTNIDFSGGIYSVSSTINAPIVSSDTNYTFQFFVTIDDVVYPIGTNTQEVLNINFGACGGSNNETLLNMSLYDEETKSNITGDIEIYTSIVSKSSDVIVGEYNDTFTSVSNASVCFTPSLSYPLYYLNAEIRYSSTGYASELYHIQNTDITDGLINLGLYDLNDNDSTVFDIIYQDSTFNFVEGAIIQLQRKYISEGIYRTVEAPLTSSEGVALVHIDLDSIKYRATVVKDGVVLDNFDNLVFKCQSELTGECQQKLLGKIDPANDINLDVIRDFSYEVSRENETITVSYSIPSGSPASTNVLLTQRDQFGNTSICNQTIISSAGSIECIFGYKIGDSYIELLISKNGESIGKKTYIIHPESYLDWLDNNYILIFILLLSLVGMALTSPEWIIVNGILTMVISGGLYLASGLDFVAGFGSLAWLLFAAIILISKISKQEDR